MAPSARWPGKFAPVPLDLIRKACGLPCGGVGPLMTLVGLCSYSSVDEHEAFPRVFQVSNLTLLKPRTTSRHLQLLREQGIIRLIGYEDGRRSMTREIIWPEGKPRYGMVPTDFIQGLALLGRMTFAVYVVLCSFRNRKNNMAWPSQGQIAEILSVNPRTIRDSLNKLQEQELIHKHHKRGPNGVIVWVLNPFPSAFKWTMQAAELHGRIGKRSLSVADLEGLGLPKRSPGKANCQAEAETADSGLPGHPSGSGGTKEGPSRRHRDASNGLQTHQLPKEKQMPASSSTRDLAAMMELPVFNGLSPDARSTKLGEVHWRLRPLGHPFRRFVRMLAFASLGLKDQQDQIIASVVASLPEPGELTELLSKHGPAWEIYEGELHGYLGGDESPWTKQLPASLQIPLASSDWNNLDPRMEIKRAAEEAQK